MTSKLQIRLGDLTLDVEGDVDLVREVYRDLKVQITGRLAQVPTAALTATPAAAQAQESPEAPDASTNGAGANGSGRKKPTKRKRGSVSSSEGQVAAYNPSIDKDADVKGVAEYYARFKPKSHSEKVLIFANFLKDKGYDPCTADQIFTCYVAAKTPRPKAFRQAIVDAHGQKHGYIDYKSVTDIRTTHIGEDHLNFTMSKEAE